MSNPFLSFVRGLTSPGYRVRVVTKHDTNDLPGGVCRGFICDSEGTLNIIDASGSPTTGLFVIKGYNPLGLKRVLTGGTAGNIWALY